MNNKKYPEQIELYNICIENRRFEAEQITTRNNFFLVFQGILFSVFTTMFSDGKSVTLIYYIIPIIGIIMSFLQTRGAIGAKYWHEVWEMKLFDIEKKLAIASGQRGVFSSIDKYNDTLKLAKEREKKELEEFIKEKPELIKKMLCGFKGSVSSIPIYIGMLCGLSWLLMIIILLFSKTVYIYRIIPI
ncbi:hypothetical protein [Avibacterium paragallinarum]|nr:hypothetical protein [Avibacterium paragallinarum]POY45365.1 hypothetical protein C3364_12495 [Avibacterium paragallinarum]RZN74250.1 hypothetical protein EC523_12930 [Avibacterium paragallinarum]